MGIFLKTSQSTSGAAELNIVMKVNKWPNYLYQKVFHEEKGVTH